MSEWIRSSQCDTAACVEVNVDHEAQVVGIRSSEDPTKVVTFTMAEWDAFVAGATEGDFTWRAGT